MKPEIEKKWIAGTLALAGGVIGFGIGGLSFGAGLLPAFLCTAAGAVLAAAAVLRYGRVKKHAAADPSEEPPQPEGEATQEAAGEEPLFYTLDLERQILNDTVSGHCRAANMALREILDQNLRQRRLSLEQRAAFCAALRQTFRRLAGRLDPENVQLRLDAVRELRGELDPESLYDQALGVYEEMVDYVEREKRDQNGLTGRILEYMQQNYHRDISLVEIAEEFHVTSYYVSRLFKNKLGVNYKDYLNRYRISRAKERMSEEPGVKIAELAESVGFNNVETFNRVFKSLEDVTPGSYLRQVRDSKADR